MTGKFIVFEGGEGSGKTGAIDIAHQAIRELTQMEPLRTREPGGTPGAESIRSILITDGANYDPIANCLLFAAARRDHIEKVIKPALDSGKWVICDRYVLSTIAYQGAEGVEKDFIIDLHNKTTDSLYPDHTIILDVDPVIGLSRSQKRLTQEQSNENRFEAYEIDFHRKMRQSMLDYNLSPMTIIDAAPSEESVRGSVRTAMESIILSLCNIE